MQPPKERPPRPAALLLPSALTRVALRLRQDFIALNVVSTVVIVVAAWAFVVILRRRRILHI